MLLEENADQEASKVTASIESADDDQCAYEPLNFGGISSPIQAATDSPLKPDFMMQARLNQAQLEIDHLTDQLSLVNQ